MQKLDPFVKDSTIRHVPSQPSVRKRPGRASRRLAAASCLAVLALFGTACSDGGGGVKDSGSAGGAKNGADEALEYRKCLRANGLDMPEPVAGGDDAPGIPLGGDGNSKATVEKALKACEDKVPAGGADSEESQADKDKQLKYRKCMREHGQDMPDPKEGEAQALPQPKSDAEAKEFQKAGKACEGELR
ncbi:hypothetical protein ACIQNU_38675 [Streptomyces sp. NPDC091292]|uniref:hypothetical protein n=1 Tax=Streptomyces sp. NPDC091292 TaxID=3365991 RepID=UPI00380C9513